MKRDGKGGASRLEFRARGVFDRLEFAFPARSLMCVFSALPRLCYLLCYVLCAVTFMICSLCSIHGPSIPCFDDCRTPLRAILIIFQLCSLLCPTLPASFSISRRGTTFPDLKDQPEHRTTFEPKQNGKDIIIHALRYKRYLDSAAHRTFMQHRFCRLHASTIGRPISHSNTKISVQYVTMAILSLVLAPTPP